MSENKFIAKLKGEPTPKSVVEIQNDRLVAPFKSSPMGHIADRDSSVVVAKGAQNWAVNQGQLVPVADDYIGTESDLTATSRVSGAGLWLNATYTFPATGDETNPVSAIIAPSAKWVLTLCGDSLITQNGSVITLTMLVKIGATHLTTKQFKIRECASQFSQRLAIDFSESEQKVIKAHGGSPLTVQVLCDDEGASATIYSGMTHLTLLQRKIDADLVSTDNVLLPEFIENLLEGYIIPADYFSRYDYIEQVEDGGRAMPEFTRNGDDMTFSGWAKPATEVYTKTEIDNKFTVANAQIDANATAIAKTRDDMNAEDSRLQTQITAHASELTTLRGNQASLGDQVSGIEEKIPGDASATNQLATKADLKGVGGDFVKKSGDTMTGILTIQAEEDYDPSTPPVGGLSFKSNASPDGFTNRMRQVGNGFIAIEYLLNGKQYSNLVFGDQQIYIDNTENGTGNPVSLGTSGNPWDNVYAKKLNNGADITIPTEGGTLARLEDVANKQDKLTAGDNIIISNNVISATGAGGGAGFDIVVVQELPATGQKGIIYLLAKDGTAPDVYDEYVWITATQTFELIGSTKVDLSGYLPTDGGTITGPITLGMTGDPFSNVDVLKSSSGASLVTGMIESGSVSTLAVRTPLTIFKELLPLADVGQSFSKVPRIYVEKINNGADISIPTTGGTMALAENVEVAIADAVANIDALPDQSGNAGKVLTTDGSTASWQEAPASGTKVIIKRYN